MSLAGIVEAATSIVLVPEPIVKSNAGPQAGAVYWPWKLKALLSAIAPSGADRASASGASAVRARRAIRREALFMILLRERAAKLHGPSPP